AANLVYVFEIGSEDLCTAALLGSPPGLGLGALVVNRDTRPFLCEPQSDAASDALCRAGNKNDFIFHDSASCRAAVAGSGSRPGICAQPQNIAVVPLRMPAAAPPTRA